jgi:UDP-GlcNAc:undecaprenyl-phosphate GlcNAc-1-phosphate transferase
VIVPAFSKLLMILVIYFGISLVLIPILRRLAWRIGLVDAPDGRRKHQTNAIPLAGGLAVLVAALMTLSASLIFDLLPTQEAKLESSFFNSLLAAIVIIAIVGYFDDRTGLSGTHKLVGQSLAITILLALGDTQIQKFELFGSYIEVGSFGGMLIAAIWLLGCINAVNLIDGMDGLLGSISVIIFLTIAFISGWAGNWIVACFAVCFAGAIIGFLCFNLPPASVYLGDCGSMVIGLVIGSLSLHSSTKGPTAVALATPIALLILPFFDTLAAIIRRKLTGRSIYTTDRGHLHHCLQRRMTRPAILILVIGFGLITSIGAIATTVWRNDVYAILAAVVVIVTLISSRLFGHAELTLIKSRLLAMFVAYRKRNTVDHRHELEVQLQGNANWNLVWDQLTREADRLNLRTICLDVNAPQFHENYHARWDRFGTSQDDPTSWRADLPLFLRGQAIGRLIAVGVRDDQSIWDKLSSLIGMLERAEEGASHVTAHHSLPPGRIETAKVASASY